MLERFEKTMKNDIVFGCVMVGLVVLFGIISYPYQSTVSGEDDRGVVPFEIVDNSDPEMIQDDEKVEQVCENGICRPVFKRATNGSPEVSQSFLGRVSLSNRRPFLSFFKRLSSRWSDRPRLRWVRFE